MPSDATPRRDDGWRPTLWMRFLAQFRLSKTAVCEASRGRGEYDDYHDYPDSVDGYPEHFVSLTCKRCGKRFRI